MGSRAKGPGSSFALLVACALVAQGRTARACAQCKSVTASDTTVWPREGVDPTVSAAIGQCWRQDANTTGAGLCGEIFVGLDLPVAPHFRLTAEAGVVQTERTESGSPDYGLSYVSGGTYLAARTFVGYDLTRLFFTRLGWELHATAQTNVALAGVLETGTRVLGHLELGLRVKLGAEGVSAHTTIALGRDTSVGDAFAQGVLVFVRGFY